jgi:hypothetical protein
MKRRRFVVVYQGGIANVFEVACFNLAPYGRDAKRIYQGDFHGARHIARGAAAAGATVKVAACNQAGDVANATWTEDLESQPFAKEIQGIA